MCENQYEIQTPLSINTILLGDRHPHSLVYHLWLHSTTGAELGSYNRDEVTHKI